MRKPARCYIVSIPRRAVRARVQLVICEVQVRRYRIPNSLREYPVGSGHNEAWQSGRRRLGSRQTGQQLTGMRLA